jgi:hypothetical protein
VLSYSDGREGRSWIVQYCGRKVVGASIVREGKEETVDGIVGGEEWEEKC